MTPDPPLAALSSRNPAVAHLRRLAHRRDARREAGAFVVEGPTLIAAALDAGIEIDAIYTDVEAAGAPWAAPLLARAGAMGIRHLDLAPGVLARAVDTVTPQPVAAIARSCDRPLRWVTSTADGLVVVLAGVADPGNVGTLLRSAEASGAKAVVACGGTADLYNPKTVRASAGALFWVPVVDAGDAAETLGVLGGAGFRIVGAAAREGTDYRLAELAGPVALVLGNEAHGIDPPVAAMVDEWVHVPIAGRAESLNVAMAGTLLAFESHRRRSG